MQQTLETLLKRWRNGALTRDELAVLKAMLKAEEYQDEYQRILDNSKGTDEYEQEAAQCYTKTYHGVVTQIDAKGTRFKLRWIKIPAIAASVVLLMAVATWVLRKSLYNAIPGDSAKVEFHGKQYLKLPDGTAIMLNDNSYLVYDSIGFGAKTREVTLVGEAYFDVAHLPDLPFIVHTQDVATTVLGTAFNVKALKGQSKIIVTVTRGKVLVGSQDKVFGQLLPNDEITINTASLAVEQKKVNTQQAIEWKSRMLIVDDITMLEAARIISDHFNKKVIVSKSLETCRITAYFTRGESLQQVLDIISLSKNGTYQITDDSASINGTWE